MAGLRDRSHRALRAASAHRAVRSDRLLARADLVTCLTLEHRILTRALAQVADEARERDTTDAGSLVVELATHLAATRTLIEPLADRLLEGDAERQMDLWLTGWASFRHLLHVEHAVEDRATHARRALEEFRAYADRYEIEVFPSIRRGGRRDELRSLAQLYNELRERALKERPELEAGHDADAPGGRAVPGDDLLTAVTALFDEGSRDHPALSPGDAEAHGEDADGPVPARGRADVP